MEILEPVVTFWHFAILVWDFVDIIPTGTLHKVCFWSTGCVCLWAAGEAYESIS